MHQNWRVLPKILTKMLEVFLWFCFDTTMFTSCESVVCDDLAWQAWWCDLVVMLLRRYDALSGIVGQWFVRTLGEEMKEVRDRRWNSERFIVFQMVILQRARHVTYPQACSRFSIRRLIAWDAVTWRARCRITIWKTMNRSEFHRLSRISFISAPNVLTNHCPTFPLSAS